MRKESIRRRKIVRGEGREEEEKEKGVRRRGVVASYPGRVGGGKRFSPPTRPGYEAKGAVVHSYVVHGSTPLAAMPQVSLQDGQGGKATVGVPGPPGGHQRVLHTLHLHQQGQLAMVPNMYCISLQLLFFLLPVFVRLLFEGGGYFFGKPADINDGWIRYVRVRW